MVKKLEMTDEEKERRRESLQIYLNHLRESLNWHTERRIAYESEMSFNEGLILGLGLGIFGNLFVQYLYAFTEGIISGEVLVILNIIIFLASAVILVAIWRKYKKKKEWTKEGIEIEKKGESMIRIAISDTQMQLKELED